jgi:peptidoglycan/LPS O-acetylase OafA/YrhL
MRFPMIDVLRAFAALTVVVFHVIAHYHWTSFPTSGPAVWFRAGGMGVDLFFVISGFVIALSAFSLLSRTGGGANFAISFAGARLARITPLHYLTCLLFLIFVQPAVIFDPRIWQQVVTHALFIHNFFLMTFGGIDGPNWSVATEMQFYVMMLLIAPWLIRADWRVILIGGVGIAWIWRLGAFCFIPTTGKWGSFPLFVGVSQLPGMLDEFTLGILLARFIRSRHGRRWLAGPMPIRFAVAATAAAATLWLAMAIYWRNSTFWNSGPMVVCSKTLLGLAWMLVILAACSVNSRVVLAVSAPLRYLGTISYGIYLWHLPVLLAVRTVRWVTPPTALVYVIGLTLILASGSWHCFELPIMRRVRQRLQRRESRIAARSDPNERRAAGPLVIDAR